MGKKIIVLAMIIQCCAAFCSCGVIEWIEPEETTASQTTAVTTQGRLIDTTKTATYGSVDEDDEDIEGYTQMQKMTGGTLENDFSRPDLYDENVRATMTTTTTVRTYYTQKETSSESSKKETSKATKKTTTSLEEQTSSQTTSFKADALYPLTDEKKYEKNVKYKVTSDTTYLNLRYGPSKEYDVQLKIPDGETITGGGETVGSDGNDWVYVTYSGISGWVMKGLLTENS